MTNPFASRSAPGQGSTPAPLRHSAAQTLLARSYPLPCALLPETLICSQKVLTAGEPVPNRTPLALLSTQSPRCNPADCGETMLTVRSMVPPGSTCDGRLREV